MRSGNVKVAIIGGGPLGLHAAQGAHLYGHVAQGEAVIIDPKPPFETLSRQVHQSIEGMNHAEGACTISSMKKHMDLRDPDAGLTHFMEGHPEFKPDKQGRPPFAAIFAQGRQVVEEFGLDKERLPATATAIHLRDNTLVIETTEGEVTSKSVVLALGQPPLNYPGWTATLRGSDNVAHIFDERFAFENITPGTNTTIIGGGITAVQAALSAARVVGGKVTLLCRRSVKPEDASIVHDEKKMSELLLAMENPDDRWKFILENTFADQIPEDLYQEFMAELANGRIDLVRSEVEHAEKSRYGDIELTLKDGTRLQTAQIILATGFKKSLPGGDLVQQAIRELGLRTSTIYGQPVVDANMAWTSDILPPDIHVFVTGAFALTAIGPRAVKMSGGMYAASIIGPQLADSSTGG